MELLRRAQEVDEAEDAQYGAEQRGDELPEELYTRADRAPIKVQTFERLEMADPGRKHVK